MKVLHNVIAYKMDKNFGTASAIAWDNAGRIIAIGDKEELFRNYAEAERIDGNGCAVLPGFIDPHIHFVHGLLLQGISSCTPEEAPTIDDLKGLLHEIARNCKEDQWTVSQGYDPSAFKGRKGPTRYDLDEVCPDRPAAIFHYSYHECVANSRALELAGIDRNTPNPFGGVIEKDRRGNPTGHLIEMAMCPIDRLARKSLLKHSKSQLMQKLPEAQRTLFSFGITRIGDPAVSPDYEALYHEALEANLLKIPVAMYPSSAKGIFEMPWDMLEHEPTHSTGDLLTVGPLKIILDGAERAAVRMSPKQLALTLLLLVMRLIRTRSLEPARVAQRNPLRFGKDGKFHGGFLMAGPEELRALVSQAVEKGFTVAIHALGNEAIYLAIDAIGRARDRHKDYPPPRMEHAILMDDELIRGTADQRIAIVTQPYFLTHMHSSNLPPVPYLKQLPLRSLIDAGVKVAGSSDWPVASADPLLAIERAVTRETTGGERLQEDEAITVKEAIAMYTSEAAYVLGCWDNVGSLEVGKRADFILLSEDPFEITGDQWNNLKVQETYLGGELVFSRSSRCDE